MEKYEASGSVRILARPEFLWQKSVEMGEMCEKLRRAFEETGDTAKSTESCFLGRSGELFRKKSEKRKREGQDTALRLKALCTKLQEIAKEYALAEKENRNVFGGN